MCISYLIKECDLTTTHTTKVYRYLMGDVDQLRTFVECPLIECKELLAEIMEELE